MQLKTQKRALPPTDVSIAAVSESGVPRMLPRSCSKGAAPGRVLALLLLLLPAPGRGTRARAATAACADWLNRFNWMRICVHNMPAVAAAYAGTACNVSKDS
jgi:hypothetical protein